MFFYVVGAFLSFVIGLIVPPLLIACAFFVWRIVTIVRANRAADRAIRDRARQRAYDQTIRFFR